MSTTCLHSYIPIYSNWILFNESNDSTISIMFPLTLCIIHEYKTGNDVITEILHIFDKSPQIVLY